MIMREGRREDVLRSRILCSNMDGSADRLRRVSRCWRRAAMGAVNSILGEACMDITVPAEGKVRQW